MIVGPVLEKNRKISHEDTKTRRYIFSKMTNYKFLISNKILNDKYKKFWENIIKFVKEILKNPITLQLIAQLVKSGTSVGIPKNRNELNFFNNSYKIKKEKRMILIFEI